MNKLSGWDDTICALATAPGVSAIGVIRLSGINTFEIADAIFPAKKISEQAANTLHVGMVKDGGYDVDEVVLSVFRAPKSFTGEDVIEISCHGSPHVQQRILQLLVKHGARLARAGEFTRRAFLHGKMDLAQAEAVADIISSETTLAQRAALQNMKGGFSRELKELREELVRFSALIELELDFATEDVEFADRKTFRHLIDKISASVVAMQDSFHLGNVIKNGVRVTIIGAPNAGKSTLLNALLNEERAIVSDIAGTTRDTVEETLNINGILFRLIDTAGIRAHTADSIEQLGIERSFDNARRADLILHIIDITNPEQAPLFTEDLIGEGKKIIRVFNKVDAKDRKDQTNNTGPAISAKQRVGIEELKTVMFNTAVGQQTSASATIITNARHLEALNKINEALVKIKDGIEANIPGDLLSADIRDALFHLGDITGEVTNEEKLDWIFGKFCIGK